MKERDILLPPVLREQELVGDLLFPSLSKTLHGELSFAFIIKKWSARITPAMPVAVTKISPRGPYPVTRG